MVPEGWSIKPLSGVTAVIDCKHRTPVYVQAGIPLVSPGTIKWGALDLVSPVKRVSQDEYKSLMDHCSVEIGDLVMSRNQSIGIASYVDSDEPFVLGQDTVLIKPYEADSKFVFYKLQSEVVQRSIAKLAGGSTFSRINLADIRKLKLHLPPLPEQKKIAQILSTWDKAITTTEQLLTNSQQQKKALMQQLLTGKKRLMDKNGVRFSGEWSSYLLEKLEELGWVMLGRGNVISKIDIENTPGDYPIYSSSVKNNGLMGKYGEHMFDEELITWSVDGGGNFFYRPKHKFSVTNVSGYMRINTEQLNYQFIAAQLEMHHSKLEFDYQSKAHPSVIRKIYTLAIPTLEEQQKIAAVLTTADQEIESLQQKVEALKQEKKALMQQLLTGKRRVLVS